MMRNRTTTWSSKMPFHVMCLYNPTRRDYNIHIFHLAWMAHTFIVTEYTVSNSFNQTLNHDTFLYVIYPHTQAIGTTKEGLHYIHQKQMLLTGATLNLCTYLLFKCQNKDVKNHPIIQRLNDFTKFADKLQAKVETPLGLDAKLTKLGRAVKLMEGQLDLIENEES